MNSANVELTGNNGSTPARAATTAAHRAEADLCEKVSEAHSLDPRAFAALIAESRSEARRRRRRLPDARLDDLVRELGAGR